MPIGERPANEDDGRVVVRAPANYDLMHGPMDDGDTIEAHWPDGRTKIIEP